VSTDPPPTQHASLIDFAAARASLVQKLEQRGIRSRAVLDALSLVPRERFVGSELQALAYEDRALPIELEQTISQPYIVALMSELSGAGPGQKVLEIGTGCGYQTAVLVALGAEVYSVELLAPLSLAARQRLAQLELQAELRVGNGYLGLPEHAPYDAILVTAAPREVPRALLQQLRVGGRLVVPIGASDEEQQLLLIRRSTEGELVEHIAPVRFVPMVGG